MRLTTRLLWRAALLVALAGTMWLMLAPSPPPPPGPKEGGDKLAHVALFAVDAFLAALAFRDRPRWQVWAAVVAFGAALEGIQGLVGRSPSVLDLLADAVGAAAAWFVPRASGQ